MSVTINMQDTEEQQTIAMYKGLLEQQRMYTNNAVSEAMRLRKIIGRCDACRKAHNETALEYHFRTAEAKEGE